MKKSQMEQADLMPLKGIKTEWDFSTLYKNPSDPKIEKDIVEIEKIYLAFAKKYSKTDAYLKDESKLFTALSDWEELVEKGSMAKPLWYLSHMESLNSSDAKITAQMGLFYPRLTKAYNEILFFSLKLGKISLNLQKKFLASKKLSHYRYFLKQIFDTAKYDLSESEEKILSLKSRPAHDLWVEGLEKLRSKQTVVYKGKHLPISEAMNMIQQLPMKERYVLHEKCMLALKGISDFAESEINAIYGNKKINDDLRGFKQPYSATILGYQNSEKSILALVDTVTKNFPVSHRFFKLKAKILGMKNLSYADRAVGIGKNEKEITFEEGLEIVRNGFNKAGKQYVDQLDFMFQNGLVDVFPKKGKRGGAYCSGGIGVPTINLLNTVKNSDSFMTLAHEMGHAIHTELSKKVSPIYQGYTTSVAEVASTLFENFAFEEMFRTLSPKEQVVALYDRVNDFVGTVFRQIACFNFENDIHTGIKEKGALSKEEIGALHNKNMSAYMGTVSKFTDLDGYFFVSWPHIRSFFYVYSYAYGALISRALYKKYKQDPSYIAKINAFMEAGASMSPEDIFKSIGIDTSKPEFFEEGLKSIEEDIDRIEKLSKQLKNK